jgi:hypothetical protein
MRCKRMNMRLERSDFFLPVVPERRPRFAVAVLVTVVVPAVFRAHVVERPGDGGLAAMAKHVVYGGFARAQRLANVITSSAV